MEGKEIYYLVISTVATYLLVYYGLYSLKANVNLYVSALVILVLIYIATFTCPIVRESGYLKYLFGKKRF